MIDSSTNGKCWNCVLSGHLQLDHSPKPDINEYILHLSIHDSGAEWEWWLASVEVRFGTEVLITLAKHQRDIKVKLLVTKSCQRSGNLSWNYS